MGNAIFLFFFLLLLLSSFGCGSGALGSSKQESQHGKGAQHAKVQIGGRVRLGNAEDKSSSETFGDPKGCFGAETGALQHVIECIETCG